MDQFLTNEIPLAEAAAYFVRLRTFDKTAQGMPGMGAVGAGAPTAPPALSATGRGMNTAGAPPPPPALPPTAMGQNTKMAWESAGRALKLAFEEMAGHMSPEGDVATADEIPPADYVANEQAAMAAEQQQEGAFYKQKLEQMGGELAAKAQSEQEAQAQVQALQQQVSQAQAQQGQYQQMVQSATQNAMMAQDRVLQEQQASAALRMAYQQLRGQMLQAASQEPPTPDMLADQATPPGADVQQSGAVPAPGAQAAPAAAGAAPQQPPAGQAPPQGSEKQASVAQAMGSALKQRLPHTLVGAGLGAAAEGVHSQMSNEPLRHKVRELEANGPPEGFGAALNLAQAKARLAFGEAAEQHPIAAMGAGAALGGLTGFMSGPGLQAEASKIRSDLQKLKALRSA
jgi:hypothetical protein